MNAGSKVRDLLWNNSLLLMFLTVWLGAGFAGVLNEVFIPPLPEVIINTIILLTTSVFWGHISSSAGIILAGFALSVVVAVPVGILMGYFVRANSALRNFIELIRPISPLALYPLFIFLFGIGFVSKLAIVFWVTWIPLLFNTISGVSSTNQQYLYVAKVMGASQIQVIKEIIIPAILPWVITGMRLAMGSALLVIVAAEMIGSNRGLGFFILNASYTFRITDIYSGIIVIAIIGISVNSVFLAWEQRVNRYNKTQHE